MNIRLILGIAALSGLTSLASAADVLPAPIEACAALKRDAERLACYDRAVAVIRSGDAAQAAPTAENMFGANTDLSTPKGQAVEVKREELRQISGSVTSLRRLDDGMIQLELDNGQIWRQQDADVRPAIAVGDKVTIVRAAMGTFKLTDKTGRFARFKRVR
ncbi:MAG TPA: hypothetical protein VMF52_09820 [Steroidobacteraceae bacterium]|nr:hypothetical protein [Steroidobacteraceae bacterium]